MNKWYLSFICLVSAPYATASLELASGITLNTLNGEVIDNVEDAVLTSGENQLVLDYTGYLSDQGKREFISTVPYIMVVDVPDNADVDVDLQSRKYAKIAKNVDRELPIFNISINGDDVEVEQEILPAAKGALPYGDIPQLVKDYNQERGLVFDSGKIRSLKEELAAVQTGAVVGATVAADSTVQESENTLQLKLWYSRANEEERKAFQKWLIDQK
ncbi:DUF2057 family protein [Vibrio splendidus]|uniref:DUF2057 family protein n=1 Tax=Vibrio splendidus TaxID=29497 RepID=A0ABD5A7Z2_VIBSP|nr:DUF2057 family protein [Vibrio splendidus]MDP2489347.1 DUF2057 family protein [Vibrio splendidus]OED85671.1 hypothetical protein A144_00370 [Vibrio splendidus ZF-90]OEF20336.1 hypothetical protein A145_01125 [Vibrio splendidus 5S-101]PMO18750.1 hypothetical protein BCT15_21535 [Vibrio splendidus]PMO49269.1 hypothetical protein BCT08_06700 [Vibrio splendidus]